MNTELHSNYYGHDVYDRTTMNTQLNALAEGQPESVKTPDFDTLYIDPRDGMYLHEYAQKGGVYPVVDTDKGVMALCHGGPNGELHDWDAYPFQGHVDIIICCYPAQVKRTHPELAHKIYGDWEVPTGFLVRELEQRADGKIPMILFNEVTWLKMHPPKVEGK